MYTVCIPTMSNDQPYQKECTFCKNKIIMSKESGKWLPYDLNNGPHECMKKNGNGNDKEKQTKTKQEFTLESVLKKLESIGIIINVERLMNNG